MRIIFLLVLVIGIGTAGYAAFLIQGRFETYQTQVNQLENDLRKTKEQVVETTPVVATTARVNFAHRLVAEDLKIINWPTADLPENTFSTIEDVIGTPEDDTRYVKRRLDAGEVLLSQKVTRFGEDIGITTLLDPGTRAFAIRVDAVSGVSGFIQPGDEVDIYWIGQDQDRTSTRLIMEKVKIIAIDQQSNQDELRPTVARTVTVQISPDTVASLLQYTASGSLSLSLRGQNDTTTSGTIITDINTLLDNKIIAVEEEQKCYRRVRRGTEVSEIEVPCTP